VNRRWIKQAKGTYDFDVTKADKLFDFLVKEGWIKLPEGHSMHRPDGVKYKKYCGFHDRNSHSINECRVFRMRIQKAIQEGHLKFDNKMKLDGNPFITYDTEAVELTATNQVPNVMMEIYTASKKLAPSELDILEKSDNANKPQPSEEVQVKMIDLGTDDSSKTTTIMAGLDPK
jgi:hypothetical protein